MPSSITQPGNVTIATVADACGVARSTVSRVLNDDKTFSLRPEIRERVRRTAAELNYRPRLAARSLRAQQTRLIGLLGSSRVHAASGLTSETIRALVEDLHGKGFDVFTSYPHRKRSEGALPPWHFDAAVVTSGDSGDAQVQLNRTGTPFVCMNAADPQGNWAVEIDEDMGMSLAIDRLVGLGHRRIAYLTTQSKWRHCSETARELAYATQLGDLGLPVLPHSTDRTMGLAEALRRWTTDLHATAVIVYDHLHALRLLAAAADAGIRVPDDLSVICFNNEFPVADVRPALSCIAISAPDVAAATAELLLQRMKADPSAAPRRVTVPVKLVERQSLATPKTAH